MKRKGAAWMDVWVFIQDFYTARASEILGRTKILMSQDLFVERAHALAVKDMTTVSTSLGGTKRATSGHEETGTKFKRPRTSPFLRP